MNILFLGGNSPRHEAWVHEMADALSSPFDGVVVHDYKHWKTGAKLVDMDYEVAEIGDKMADLEPYVVFAKSIGTMITLKAMHQNTLRPKACVFLGLPLNAITDMELPAVDWLSEATVPLYFLQNEDDPYGPAEQLKATLPANIDQANITVLPGDTHDYNDIAAMTTLLARASA